jgi:hypothetical protein
VSDAEAIKAAARAAEQAGALKTAAEAEGPSEAPAQLYAVFVETWCQGIRDLLTMRAYASSPAEAVEMLISPLELGEHGNIGLIEVCEASALQRFEARPHRWSTKPAE